MKKMSCEDLIGMNVPDILHVAKEEKWQWENLSRALLIKSMLIMEKQTDSLDTISDRLKGLIYTLENNPK